MLLYSFIKATINMNNVVLKLLEFNLMLTSTKNPIMLIKSTKSPFFK
jgi:hypothetical protein